MKKPCKISIVSTRKTNVTDLFLALRENAAKLDDLDEDDSFFNALFGDTFSETDENEEETTPSSVTSTLTAWGLFSREKDGSRRITYEDSEITGLEGCLTTFCLAPTGMLILLRRGPIRTCMIFEKGARHLCDYASQADLPPVFLHTQELVDTLGDEGGEIRVGYSVEIRGSTTERNELSIRVEPV